VNVSESSARLFSLWDTPAFSVGDDEYAWIDVALWAMASGAWTTFERQLAVGLACVARADAEHSGPSDQELDDAATAFRYDRDLLAAAEVNDWLERCDLSVEDWTAYLRRGLLRERWRDTLDDTLQRHPPSTTQLVAAAYAEGVCSGAFETFADSSAARVALATASERPAVRLGEPGEADTHRLATAHACWLSLRPATDTRVRLQRAVTLEAQFDALVEDLLARTPLQEIVEQHQLQWQQIELDTLHFTTEHAAREAVLCVTVDRLSLHDVAVLSRRAAARELFFADELDADRRDHLLGVEPGRVLGPWPVNGHYEVSAVVRRTLPALSDPRVADRARRRVIDTALQRATRDHVTRRSRD
jgi:hypothetical protein